ncbi:hypothetical protein GNI_201770 [Gregarina niphandrodes]|uniref:Uncharacterized protein n=1 Tax=Gregarina niphandrodes TaxID=110365 RepID=A0A023AXI0_GRENI|nr:hypothetical protein GNI_201770 [Gregarina niphandrodes]EZG42980.1 hypothetical protein GNI_201770 [Gregarina niphandrodes]|eukprot:XP_011133747.1 hypothetical protein GNI_201770 [Gregarina niphandrodes]
MSDDIVILGYQFSPDKISIPQKKSEEIRLKLRSSCAADVVKATHQLTYYKMILKPSVRNTLLKIRQILTKTNQITNVAQDLIEAVDVEWSMERIKPDDSKELMIFVDASDMQAGMVVIYNGQTVMTESLALTKTSTTLASYKEVQGAYKLLTKYKSAIDFIDKEARKTIVTDSLRLWQALQRVEEPRNDLEVYAARTRALYCARYEHIPGGLNPADFFSRRHRLLT